jgi:DNA processing protein
MAVDAASFALAALTVRGVPRRHVRAAVHAWRAGVENDVARQQPIVETIARQRRRPEFAELQQAVYAHRLAWLDAGDPRFPPSLLDIPDPPIGLFVSGSIDALVGDAIAIVGSRRATALGLTIAEQLSRDVASEGLRVVSGLAHGIDAAAHRGALAARGVTVAVLGGGHARLYPARHASLAETIVSNAGSIVSEYPPDCPSYKEQFPERNRLVSGLARGVIVVEASVRSGSLITARCALEQGREVMAVPGPVGAPTSRGCHRLIKQGAALVEDADDVLNAIGIERRTRVTSNDCVDAALDLDARSRAVLDAVGFTVTGTDDIVDVTGFEVGEVLRCLSMLELRAFVEAMTGGYIRRPSPLG